MNISSKTLFKLYSLVITGLVSQNIYAVSTISSPAEIVVVSINDQVIKSSFLKNAKDYKVNAGETRLSLRYQEYFENGIGQHDIIKSDIINITVPALQDHQNYVLKLVNAPKNYDDAKKYSEQPEIAIFDQKNNKIQQQIGMAAQSKTSLIDSLFGSSVNVTQSRTADSQTSNANSQISSSKNPNTASQSSLTSDQQLIQIWQGASKSERQKFMSWLAEQ